MAKYPSHFISILLFCCWVAVSNAKYTIYQDSKQPINKRVKDLLSRMSLKEKVGQMTQIEREVASADVMKKYYIGSVLSGGGSVPGPQASAEMWVDMVNGFQNGSLSTPLKIPMLEPQLVKRIGSATALEVRATGIQYAFAPCVAVCRDPRWGRCYESYGEYPELVQNMTEIILGLQGDIPANYTKGVPFVDGPEKVLASAKHYVGDGGTTKGINENNTNVSPRELESIHMPPYLDSISKGVGTVMVSYSSLNGVKMHANRKLITDYLKNKLKFKANFEFIVILLFQGFVISDWQGIDKITSPPGSNYTYSILASINAGIDMIMVPYNYQEFIDGLISLVKKNFIHITRINDAVTRILRVKFTMGLFENPLADYSMAKYLGCQEHRELAREAVRKSLVLLKNGKSTGKPLLPLPKRASKILVTGTHADDIGNQCGGWTIQWQGQPGNITAVVVGEPPYAETSGDSMNLTLPESGTALISKVCGSIKCVVVLITGRPVVIEPYLTQMDALVAAWLPGTEGQGVADVLFGDYGFTGKLPRTWFKTVDQLPMNVGDDNYDPLFAYGLEDLKMAKAPPLLLSILLFCYWIAISNAGYALYQDSKQPISKRVEDLLSRMSLAEKVGQMTQIERAVASADVMKKYYIGSVLSGGGSVPGPQASAEMWIDMVNGFQNGSLSTPLKIPMLDPQLVKKIGAATALEVRATGIPYVFAPCIAVCRDPRWGRCYESYSEYPELVQNMTEIILGLQGDIPANYTKGVPFLAGQNNVLASAKHYVGDGGTTNGINENNTNVSPRELESIHMPPYLDSISKGVGTVMVSYSSLNGVKMHANRKLITDYLKNKLKFKGFVISDWEGIDRITSPPHSNYTYSILAGINAGIDMVMVPNNYTEFIDGLTSLVKRNFISKTRIDDAVRRILRVKFTMGLFEYPLANDSMIKHLGSQEHKELAREAVRKSLVLLKNGESADKRPILPLPKTASKILVAGTHADNIGYQCGGWTIKWQGQSGNITSGTTILTAIKNAVDKNTQVVFSENPPPELLKSHNFSYAIVVVGEPPYAETFGDNLNLTLPNPAPAIIKNVCGSVKCVVVLITGRPVVIEPYLSVIDGLVAAWLPGTEGHGVADVLFGDYGFGGKLPRTWFKTVEQLPMNFGDEHYEPLFSFGYGLTTDSMKGSN
ncbi:4-glucanase [Striga asiatica]|uniref:4-glucanase n=1 Tax=Striga asiatica TaxID=4170 RepID=A0A5A7P3E3_STRAF|nr:4-glucanase [Striga asiatica]